MREVATRRWRRWVLGAAAASLLGTAGCTTGDEPPIRVKNGSLELWLLSNKGWSQDGNARNWKAPGRRRNDDLNVVMTVGDGAVCKAPLDRSGRKLEVHYSDGTEVDFQSTGNHMKVVGSKDLTRRNDATQVLTYEGGANDYISSFVLDGSNICTFTSKAQLHSLVILDY